MAISTDSVYAHKVFTEVSPRAGTVNFPLLSDRNHQVSKRYCVLDEMKGACLRVVYIIDPEGIIQSILVYPDHVGKSTAELLRLIQGLQYSRETGLAIPANWVPGKPGIERKWENVGKI